MICLVSTGKILIEIRIIAKKDFPSVFSGSSL